MEASFDSVSDVPEKQRNRTLCALTCFVFMAMNCFWHYVRLQNQLYLKVIVTETHPIYPNLEQRLTADPDPGPDLKEKEEKTNEDKNSTFCLEILPKKQYFVGFQHKTGHIIGQHLFRYLAQFCGIKGFVIELDNKPSLVTKVSDFGGGMT